jgi:hypothetical protein
MVLRRRHYGPVRRPSLGICLQDVDADRCSDQPKWSVVNCLLQIRGQAARRCCIRRRYEGQSSAEQVDNSPTEYNGQQIRSLVSYDAARIEDEVHPEQDEHAKQNGFFAPWYLLNRPHAPPIGAAFLASIVVSLIGEYSILTIGLTIILWTLFISLIANDALRLGTWLRAHRVSESVFGEENQQMRERKNKSSGEELQE